MSSRETMVVLLLVVFCPFSLCTAHPWETMGANSARTYQSSAEGPGGSITPLKKTPLPETFDPPDWWYPYLYPTYPLSWPFVIEEGGRIFTHDYMHLIGMDGYGNADVRYYQGFTNYNYAPILSGNRLIAIKYGIIRAFDFYGNLTCENDLHSDNPEVEDVDIYKPPAMLPNGTFVAGGSIKYVPDERYFQVLLNVDELGDVKWFTSIDYIIGPPAVSADGLIVISTTPDMYNFGSIERGDVICYSPEGEELWRVKSPDGFRQPVIDDARGRVLVRTHESPNIVTGVLCIDLISGECLWHCEPKDCASSSPNGTPYPLTLDARTGTCYAVWDVAGDYMPTVMTAIGTDGSILWKRTWEHIGVGDGVWFQIATHPVIDADGFIYILGQMALKPYNRDDYSCFIEVLNPDGALVAKVKWPPGFSDFPMELIIGADRRIYWLDTDFELGYPTYSMLVFGSADDPLLESYRPTIHSAGYASTELSADGGRLHISATVSHPLSYASIAKVEVLMSGQPTGILLPTTGTLGFYDLRLDLSDTRLPPGEHVLEIVATDTAGKRSDVWPYLNAP